MNTRFLPILVASLALAAAGSVSAQSKPESTGKAAVPAKAVKAGAKGSQQSDLGTKPISDRSSTKPATPASLRSAPSGAGMDSGCSHSKDADA